MKWLSSKLFNARARNHERLGVEFTEQGVAFAYIQRVAGQLPRWLHGEFLPADGSPAPERLRRRLQELNLLAKPCNVVLAQADYQLLLGDAPSVPPEELAEALRWRVKDLVSFPVSDAVMDAFMLPESCSRANARLAYATVAKRPAITAVVDAVKHIGLNLYAISIPELALANLLQAGCDTSRAVALVNLVPGGGTLLLVRDNELYLARNFKLNFNGGLLDDIPADAFALELQRSLDYFERQMRQSPPMQIFVIGENISDDKISPELRRALSANIAVFSLSRCVSIAEHIPEHHIALCARALGVALREDEIS